MSSPVPPSVDDASLDDALERDALAQQLFEAARQERPSARSQERALTSASRQRSTRHRGRWLAAALAFGAACVLALRLVPQEPDLPSTVRITAEPVARVARALEVAPSTPTPGPQEEPSHARSAATQSGPAADESAPSKSAAPAPATLEEELALLDRARRALLGSDPAAALEALGQYDAQASRRHLDSEATLLRIQVLAAAGRSSEASVLASEFVRQHPDSPLVDRAKSFIAEPSGGAERVGVQP